MSSSSFPCFFGNALKDFRRTRNHTHESTLMGKITVGLLLGLALGFIDGASAWFYPEARSMMAAIVVGSSLKGMLVGILSGFARKVQSTVWGVVVGAALGTLLAFIVAAVPSADGTHYYFEI